MSLLLMADILAAVDQAGKAELQVVLCCVENKSQWTTPETRRANIVLRDHPWQYGLSLQASSWVRGCVKFVLGL